MESSASQCEKYEQCPRRWWFEYVGGFKPPDTGSQAFGSGLHLLCASVLTENPNDRWSDGLGLVDIRKIERMVGRATAKKLLRPAPELVVEQPFALAVGDITVHGKIDCWNPETLTITDHKVHSSDEWALDPDDLKADLAMMVYAGRVLREVPDAPHLWLRHNQFIKNTGDVFLAETRVSPEHVREFWKRQIMPALRGQKAVRINTQWECVEGKPKGSKACGAFGGCPFEPICHGGVNINKFAFEEVVPLTQDGVPF